MEYKSPKARSLFSPSLVRLLREKLTAFSLRHLISPPDAVSRRIVTAALPKKRAAPRLPLPGPDTGAPHFPTDTSLPAPAGAAAAQGRSPARTAASVGPPEPLSHRLLQLPPSGRDPPPVPRPRRDRTGNSGWEQWWRDQSPFPSSAGCGVGRGGPRERRSAAGQTAAPSAGCAAGREAGERELPL